MFYDVENLNPLMEDFNEILLDYDIACEGFMETVKSAASKVIETLIRLFRQAFQFIRTKLKSKPKKDPLTEDLEKMVREAEAMAERLDRKAEQDKKLDEEIDNMTDGFIKSGVELELTNWKLNQLPAAFEAAFNMFKFNELFQVFPIYSNALQDDGSTFIKGVKDKLLDIYDKYDEGLDSIELKAFIDDPQKIKVSSKTPEGLKQAKHYMTIASVVQRVEKVIDGKEAKIMGELQKFRNQVNDINLSANFEQGDIGAKQAISRTMTRIMTYVNKDTTKTVQFLTGLVDRLNKDYNKFVTVFFK